MKKLLGKKATFITCLVVAIVMLALVVFMCVRPVSSGLSYNGKNSEMGVEANVAVKVWGNTLNVKMKSKTDGKKNYVSMDEWAYRDGYNMLTLGTKKINKYIVAGNDMTSSAKDTMPTVSKDEYKASVKNLKELKKTSADLYNAGFDTKVSAFKMEMDGTTLTCTSAIILVVVFALVDAVAIAGTVGSIIVRKKKA